MVLLATFAEQCVIAVAQSSFNLAWHASATTVQGCQHQLNRDNVGTLFASCMSGQTKHNMQDPVVCVCLLNNVKNIFQFAFNCFSD